MPISKYFFLVLFFAASFQVNAAAENQSAVYLFHLYYDNGQLFADRDFTIKYDLLSEEYVAPAATSQFMYRGEVMSFSGAVVGNFEFDPKNGDTQFNVGKISVKAPYAPNAEKVNFYDSQSEQLLTIFVDQSAVCNEDLSCDSEKGENSLNCSYDCRDNSAGQAPATENPDSSAQRGNVVSAVITLVAGVGIILGLIFGKRWLNRRRQNDYLSPPPGI